MRTASLLAALCLFTVPATLVAQPGSTSRPANTQDPAAKEAAAKAEKRANRYYKV